MKVCTIVETMLDPELIRLLTDSDYLSKSCTEGILTIDTQCSKELRQNEGCSDDNNTPTPFTFTPQRIHVNKDHELFEDGDVLRHLYIQSLSTLEADDKPNLSVCEFGCHISGCSQVFSSVEEYEHHYNSLHRHVCCSCRRSLPSARLLDIHIQEWHDSLFSILAERQDMYQCLVEGCEQKFRTSKPRKDHMITIHKYPPDFRFDKAKKDKRATEEKRAQRETTMDVMEDVCEAEGVCEEMEAMELHLSQEGETVEALHTACSSTMEANTQVSASSHDAAATSTEQLKPRYSYRVPKTVCFGPGSVRGFRGRGKRK